MILLRHVALGAATILATPSAGLTQAAKDVFAKVAPSVVAVQGWDEGDKNVAQGSGVVVGDFEVITNCHIIEKARKLAVRQVVDQTGSESYLMEATIVARDLQRNLCLLFVDKLQEPPAATAAHMAAAKGLSVGDEVIAVGAVEGQRLSFSRQIVSQLRRDFGKRSAPLIKTNTSMSRCSSGGGLFNQAGELVGITTFVWRSDSLNIAQPVEWVMALRKRGKSELTRARARSACPGNPTYDCLVDLALEAARLKAPPAFICKSLLHIALVQAKVGDVDGVQLTLTNAYETARFGINGEQGFGDLSHVQKLGEIAAAQSKNGDERATERTFAILDRAVQKFFGDKNRLQVHRNYALALLASAHADAGNITNAIEIAETIRFERNSDWRQYAWRDIAIGQAVSGDFSNAKKTAMSITDSSYRRMAIRGIAFASARAGFYREAIKLALNHREKSRKTTNLFEIATLQLRIGDAESAKRTLMYVPPAEEYDAEVKRMQGTIQALMGNFTQARVIADSIDVQDVESRLSLLSEIAVLQAQAGDRRGARQTSNSTLELIRTIPDYKWEGLSMSRVAVALAKAGDLSAARKVFSDALVSSRNTKDDDWDGAWTKDLELRSIAMDQAVAGLLSSAVETALSINVKPTPYRIKALMSIARILARGNDTSSRWREGTSWQID